MIEKMFNGLIGLQIFKSWNIFATRIFYFAAPGFENRADDGDYRLTLECPWRIEKRDRILVGSEDYGLPAEDNLDPGWNPAEMQWGHLQDQKLVEIMGEKRNGEIFNMRPEFVVEDVKADQLGGFQLSLSGEYRLSVFPASSSAMEWLLSRQSGGNVSLMNAALSESLTGPERRFQ